MAKTIITAALTGAVTPAGFKIPETPEQIAQEAYDCWKAGASIVHLHMRDDEGAGVMDPVKFYQTIKAIRAYKDCDVIINCTSSGDNRVSDDSPYGNAYRVLHHKFVPGIEMGTFDAGSFNWGPAGVFHNSPQFLRDIGKLYIEKGIKPEIEIFDAGMLRACKEYYLKGGYLTMPMHFQLCMGVLGGMGATPAELQYLIDLIPEGCTWSAFGIGKGHMPVMFSTLANGGHIRVGMEDNVVYGVDKNGNKIMATNVMLVERAVNAIKAFGNDVATPAEAREMLSIKPLDHDAVCAALDEITIDYLNEKKAELNGLTRYMGADEKSMGGKK
ncbi:MAG: 3-keto-5-aminohexanoate cleavage protein [Oscillospiraceae bacterium]|jgi:3-keto-5-aminohexanoate cleavage enzyme